jgi:integrase/recombinase XerD
MEMNRATATLLLDKRSAKKSGHYPLKLTIYCKPDKKRYRTNIDLTQEEWEKINSSRLKDDRLKELKYRIHSMLNKANEVLNSMSAFSFVEFERNFFKNAISREGMKLSSLFNEYISELKTQGRVGTESAYKTTYNSLVKFKGDINISEIDSKYLTNYEDMLKNEGKSPSTIGIYLRQLRTIINRAIKKGIIKQENYPFKGFEIPVSRNIKKALSDEELTKLLHFKPSTNEQKLAYDFWMFSYLCNGMNMVDILTLEKTNLDKNFLAFFRKKTLRTKKKDLRPIKVPLHSKALDILDRRRSKSTDSKFLFPYLREEMSPRTIKNKVQAFIKFVNSEMEGIKNELSIEKSCTTYTARHTFSTRLMRMGVSTQFIKESLGHSSVAVTENYLSDFSDEIKLSYVNYLTEI